VIPRNNRNSAEKEMMIMLFRAPGKSVVLELLPNHEKFSQDDPLRRFFQNNTMKQRDMADETDNSILSLIGRIPSVRSDKTGESKSQQERLRAFLAQFILLTKISVISGCLAFQMIA
jgi:hypothetical protein